MNVLVTDADPTVRQVLKRALSRTYGCEIFEAATGLEALDAMAERHMDIVILDVRLPIMDGIEVSEAMRESTQFRNTPIVMLTAERDAEIIARLVHIGVSDVVLKPLRVDRFVPRFGALVSKFLASRQKVAPTQGPPPELVPGATVLLVDGDSEYRAFFEKTLGGHFIIGSLETGAAAIARCLSAEPPKTVFIGKDLGLVSPEFLARKLRSSLGSRIRLIVVAAKRDVEALREQAWADNVIPRSFVAATLTAEVRKLLQQASTLAQFNADFPGLRLAVLAAAEQVSGLMLNSEVEATDGPIKVDRDRVAGAAVEIRVAAFTLHVQIRYTFEAGRYVAGAFLTMSPDDVTPDDVESVAGELANVIGGRLHTQYSKSAPDSDMSLPTLRTADAGAASEAPDHNSTICLTFNEVYSPLAFEVRVRVEHAPTVTLMEPGDSEGAFASVRTAG